MYSFTRVITLKTLAITLALLLQIMHQKFATTILKISSHAQRYNRKDSIF